MKRRTLLGHLLAWVLCALALVWVGFVAIGLTTGVHEADELTDGHLASTASLLLSQRTNEFVGSRDAGPPTPDLKRHDYQQSMSGELRPKDMIYLACCVAAASNLNFYLIGGDQSRWILLLSPAKTKSQIASRHRAHVK